MKDKTLKIVLIIAFLLPILIFIVTLFLPYPYEDGEYHTIDRENKVVFLHEHWGSVEVYEDFPLRTFKNYTFVFEGDLSYYDEFIGTEYKVVIPDEGSFRHISYVIDSDNKTLTFKPRYEKETFDYAYETTFDHIFTQDRFKGYTVVIEEGLTGYPDFLCEHEDMYKEIIYPLSQSYYDEFTYTIDEVAKEIHVDGNGVIGSISKDIFPEKKFNGYSIIFSENVIGFPHIHDTPLELYHHMDGKLSDTIFYSVDRENKTITLSGKGTLPDYYYSDVFPTDYFEGYTMKVDPDIAGSNRYLIENYNPNLPEKGYLTPDFTYEVDKDKKTITVKGYGEIPALNPEAFDYLSEDEDYTMIFTNGITGAETVFDVCDTVIVNSGMKKLPPANGKYYEVDSKNQHFTSYKGALYTKDGKKLLCYPKNKRASEFHPNTEVITKDAFNNYNTDATIVIPWGTLEIEDEAFGNTYENITYVIPDTVTKAGWPSQERQISPSTYIHPMWIPSRHNQVVWDKWMSDGHRSAILAENYGASGYFDEIMYIPNDNIASYYKIAPNSFKTFENGKTYYFDSNYKMVTGSKEIDGKQYYFDENGVLTE